jgi:hypothetical protein
LVNVLRTKAKKVLEILKSIISYSTGIMVHLGPFLFIAFDSGSNVLIKCTLLDRKKGQTSLHEILKRNIQMWFGRVRHVP